MPSSAQSDLAVDLERERELRAERDRYRRALEHIREHEGKVCDQFELCEHRACQSSYGAWSIADGALGCTEPLAE